MEAERGHGAVRADRERERPRALVPVGALEDPRLALEPASVRLLDVLAARREDVEDEAAVGFEQAASRAQRAELLVLGLHVQERAERADDERDALVDGWLAQVSEAEVDAAGDAGLVGGRPRHGEHRRRGVDADDVDARLGRSGTAMRPVPTASSTTGPPDARASST